MIDVHAHVLPGLDDGPSKLGDSLEMVWIARAAGTRKIVATPHLRRDYPAVTPDSIREHVVTLNRALSARSIDCKILSGAEVDAHVALKLAPEIARSVSLGGAGHVLLEAPWDDDYELVLAATRHLHASGCGVILAHPERSPALRGAPDRLRELISPACYSRSTRAHSRDPRRARALAKPSQSCALAKHTW